MSKDLRVVILAGGTGTRLWPISRRARPKQFLALVGDKTQSLLQQTVERVKALTDLPIVLVCSEEHRFMVAEQMRESGVANEIILEPCSRNTAPAIAIAALYSLDVHSSDTTLLIVPADQALDHLPPFHDAVLRAKKVAALDKLVTFGIAPRSAHKGYGYILSESRDAPESRVVNFVEKPTAEKAEEYLVSGKYLWNSGMFAFKPSVFLSELKRFRKETFALCETAYFGAYEDLDFKRLPEESYASVPSESIDYAVMENSAAAHVIKLDAPWSDIGSWSALAELTDPDEHGNSIHGDVVLENVSGCFVRSEGQLIAALNIQDLIIVSTPDTVLVTAKDASEDVKFLVEKLKSKSRPEWELHREVHRPWGKFDSVDKGAGYQIKRITVSPGAKLSLQMHHHRSEHWVVVSGIAKVTNGSESFLLSENQSTFIDVGVVHSLENPGKLPLELIEVQVGSYLGEDDIVRFSDVYGRVDGELNSGVE